ncbi:MAG: transposase, family protein/SWIM domain fusion [Phycisphaerales bacterium]|nr:transposase, family protein/SWIM domain fusion [Phycisphaerales bacterium]
MNDANNTPGLFDQRPAYQLPANVIPVPAGVDHRPIRGMEIAAVARIDRDGDYYLVPSQSGQPRYKVWYNEQHPSCDCPDFETRGCKCKHIWAVEYTLKRETAVAVDPSGNTTVTETVTVTKKTYSQDWPAYNEAQTNEKRQFQVLLHELCKGLSEPVPADGKPRRGRRPYPMCDAIFSVVFKVYSTFSGRRFESDLCAAQEKGYIDKVPHYNSVFNYIEDPNLFPVLVGLIEQAALPLKAVESKFAVDSTGFAFSRFARWFDIKYNRFTTEKQWVKAHFCTGVKTNVITAVEIHGKDAGDSPLLPPLVATTKANGFTMKEVSADKGYSGTDAHEAIAAAGAVPYVMFKANATGAVGGLFQKMFGYFQFKREEFLSHYHQRSNVESTVSMIKAKFGDAVRSKSEVAAKNEVLCKILCHNICCLISAIYELGIQPVFPLDACPTIPASAQQMPAFS